MSITTHLNIDNFDETVNSGSTVLVDFWAPWCGPCKMISPIIEDVAQQLQGKAVVCKVNVDEEAELSSKYGIMSIPSLFVFKNGKVVDKMIGVPQSNTKSAIISLVEKNI